MLMRSIGSCISDAQHQSPARRAIYFCRCASATGKQPPLHKARRATQKTAHHAHPLPLARKRLGRVVGCSLSVGLRTTAVYVPPSGLRPMLMRSISPSPEGDTKDRASGPASSACAEEAGCGGWGTPIRRLTHDGSLCSALRAKTDASHRGSMRCVLIDRCR